MTRMDESKFCAFDDCRKVMLRRDYPSNKNFRITRYCCSSCGQQARNSAGWERIIAYKVVPGIELTLEQIAEIGGVSKQACEQKLNRALDKLYRNPVLRQLAIQVLNIDITPQVVSNEGLLREGRAA